MKNLNEVLTAVFAQIIEFYQQELNIKRDTHDVELRPEGLQLFADKLLRRALVEAANDGNTDLTNQIANYMSKPRDYVLHSGFTSELRLMSEKSKGAKRARIYPLCVNEMGRLWMEKAKRPMPEKRHILN